MIQSKNTIKLIKKEIGLSSNDEITYRLVFLSEDFQFGDSISIVVDKEKFEEAIINTKYYINLEAKN